MDFVDGTGTGGLVARDELTGKYQAHRLPLSDKSGQPLSRSGSRNDPEADLGLSVPFVAVAEPDVTGEHELAATTERVAVDASDDWLGRRPTRESCR